MDSQCTPVTPSRLLPHGGARRSLRAAALAFTLAAMTTAGWPAAPALAAGNGDEFFVVDCLLPPQIRKLGRSMTFLGPKRVVKTTGNDCEIRGGEYIAQDRASYGTSLKIWMAEAEAGNPEAMNNVGEIFERGFQDYAAAVQWYRKAAGAGSSRAQLNLGMAYEQGRGVPQDAQEALRWYRKGSGLSDLVVDQAAIDAARAESAAEISGLKQQVAELKAQLDQAQSKLGGLRTQLGDKEQKAAAAHNEVAQLRQQLAARKAGGGASSGSAYSDAEVAQLRQQLKQAEQQLAQREAKLAERNSELAVLRELLRRRESEAADRQANLEQLRQKSSTSGETVAALQAEMDARNREIEMLRTQLYKEAEESAQNETSAQQTQEQAQAAWMEVMTLRTQIAMLQEENAGSADVTQLEAVIRQREQELAARNSEVSELKQQIASLSERSDDLKYQITRIQDEGGAPPIEIEIIEPQLAQFRGLPGIKLRSPVSEVTVVGKVVASKPLLNVVINDQTVRLNEDNVFRTAVPVRGERTEVRVAAVDKSGSRAETSFEIFGPGGAVQSASLTPADSVAIEPGSINFGRYHALVIGNDKFLYLPKLDTAVNDANAVARLLKDHYGFKVTLLINANRYEILSALNKLRETLNQDDNLLIYYAGHGELDRKNARGYWLPTDAEKESTANWIAATALTDILNVMNARQVMIVADSCYSGALTRSILARLESGRTPEAQKAWYETMARKRSRTVLTSGGLAPVSDSGGGEHSVFAKAFLDVLKQSDVVVTGQTLFQEVSARVTYAMADAGFEQVPAYAPLIHAGHELGDFFFVPTL